MGLIESIRKNIGGGAKIHKPERTVKSRISRTFYTDGNLLIKRFDEVYNCELIDNRSFRAKMFVDLLMSIECSLKSLIISLSKDHESPAKSYKKTRKLGHKIDGLYKEVKKRAKNRFKLPKRNEKIFEDLMKLGVGSRYSYDIWIMRLDSSNRPIYLGDNLISNTIDNQKWGISVREEAIKLNILASECHKKYLSNHSALWGKKFGHYDAKLKEFLNEVTGAKNKPMKQEYIPIETPMGVLCGRDIFYLDKIRNEIEKSAKLIITGSISYESNADVPYEVHFNGVEVFKQIELDFWLASDTPNFTDTSSFYEVRNSNLTDVKPGYTRSKLTHVVLQTYDWVFVVVCKDYQLLLNESS